MSEGKAGPNPYVGPRPFRLGEPLFGRDSEARDLFYLLNAERIVLLHSPSGAGKSSLVQAGLIPRLKQEDFDIWPTIRVSLEPPAGIAVNRYVSSTILSLEEELPEPLRRDVQALSTLNLDQYVSSRPRRRNAPPNLVLIFDQFEEVLTADPVALDAKREFFGQLGELLRRREVWALFVLREDYLAPLDPYAPLVPTQLKNRFRLDLLGLDAAAEAIRKPAEAAGREYAPDVAERLVRDLSAISVQQVDGSFVKEMGSTVEPVQLQVVCRRLWDAMPADDLRIDTEHLERFGDVNNALEAYYDLALASVSGGERFLERTIRDWFNDKLIVRGGIRGQTMRGESATDGVENLVIQKLLDTHLIRAEKRRAATWFELAHDRLIQPVTSSNTRWFETNLEEFQRRATVWERNGNPDGLLLLDEDLKKAEAWVSQFHKTTPYEDRFLEASRRQQEVVDQQKLHVRKLRLRSILASAAALVALALFAATLITARQKLQAERAESAAQTAQSVAEKNASEAQTAQSIAEKNASAAQAAQSVAQKQASAAQIMALQLRKSRDRIFLDLLERIIQLPITVAKNARAGGVEASDKEWEVLIRGAGRNKVPFAMARAVDGSTKGRIVMVGQVSFLVYRDENSDNQPLGTVLLWLKGERKGTVLIRDNPQDAFYRNFAQPAMDTLKQKLDGWSFQTEFTKDLSDPGALGRADILVIPDAWSDFSDRETKAIVNFVENGGGLLATGFGWRWQTQGPGTTQNRTLDAYPMNKLFANFGARWNGGLLVK
jgi:hypothetical protein